MPVRAIVSYDGTDNDHDAIALGRIFVRAGATVDLAYVRHTEEVSDTREEMARSEARRLLEAGAVLLGTPDARTHVAVNASTPDGLATLASLLDAHLIVFGSAYRTPEGRVRPQPSAQRLLDGGPTAVAIAPAGMRNWNDAHLSEVSTVGHDGLAAETSGRLAEALGGTVIEGWDGADIFVVGSRPDAPPRKIAMTAATAARVEDAPLPILAIPTGGLYFK